MAIFATLGAAADAAARRSQPYAPVNDNFANAIELLSSTQASPGMLQYASREFGEPRARSSSIGRTVWYTYTATQDGRAVVGIASSFGAAAPLNIAVYTGDVISALTPVGAAQVTRTGKRSTGSVAFDTKAGKTYRIQVDVSRKLDDSDREYWIGIQQFGPEGGVAIFGSAPWTIRDDGSDTLQFFVANAFKVRVRLSERFETLSPYFRTTKTHTTINPGRTSWYTIQDRSTATIDEETETAGRFTVNAADAATGSRIGTNSVKVFGTIYSYLSSPRLTVQFQYPELGARPYGEIESLVTVWNTSTTDGAHSCFFHDPQEWEAAYGFGQVVAGEDGLSNVDEPFDVPPASSKQFKVKLRGHPDYYRTGQAILACGDAYADVNSDMRATLSALSDFGVASQVQMDVLNTLEFERIQIDNFQTKRIVVSVKNTGEYAGFFRISGEGNETAAKITRTCVSDEKGTCLDDPDITDTEVNLARGEMVYVTFRTTRGSDDSSVIVNFRATSIDSDHPREAGGTNVEVILPPEEERRR